MLSPLDPRPGTDFPCRLPVRVVCSHSCRQCRPDAGGSTARAGHTVRATIENPHSAGRPPTRPSLSTSRETLGSVDLLSPVGERWRSGSMTPAVPFRLWACCRLWRMSRSGGHDRAARRTAPATGTRPTQQWLRQIRDLLLRAVGDRSRSDRAYAGQEPPPNAAAVSTPRHSRISPAVANRSTRSASNLHAAPGLRNGTTPRQARPAAPARSPHLPAQAPGSQHHCRCSPAAIGARPAFGAGPSQRQSALSAAEAAATCVPAAIDSLHRPGQALVEAMNAPMAAAPPRAPSWTGTPAPDALTSAEVYALSTRSATR